MTTKKLEDVSLRSVRLLVRSEIINGATAAYETGWNRALMRVLDRLRSHQREAKRLESKPKKRRNA